MKAIFFILKNTELLKSLLDELKKNKITGGTIIESKGMATEMAKDDEFMFFDALRHILTEEYKKTFTLMFVANEEREKIILQTIDKIVGKLDKPNTGIIFAVPIDYAKGIKF